MFPVKVELKDGRIAVIDFLKKSDSTKELQQFANSFVDENAMLRYDKKFSLKEKGKFKQVQLSAKRRKKGFMLLARVDGKLAGTTSAARERGKARHNVSLSIAVGKAFRGLGVGKALLDLNIATVKRLLEPRNIFLNVQKHNRWAISLYEKMGFKVFAVFPDWVLQEGEYVDRIFMRLED